MDNKRADFNVRDAGAGYLVAIAALLIPQFILALVWIVGMEAFGWRDIAEVQAESFAFLIISGAALQLFLGLAYFLFTRGFRVAPRRNERRLGIVYSLFSKANYRIDPINAPRLQNMPARNWLLSAAAGVAAIFGLMFTSFSFDIFFTDVLKYSPPDMPAFDTAGKAVLGIIFVGVFPAVFEELIFRGIVLRGLAPLGRTKAVLISAAAFALAHMSPSQTVHQFLLGVIMGLIAWETGSILAPMLIHFINNALSVTLEVSGFFGLIEKMRIWEIIVVALVTLAAVCGIMYLILRFIIKPARDKDAQYAFTPDGNAPLQTKRLIDDKPAFWFLLSGFAITAVMWVAALVM